MHIAHVLHIYIACIFHIHYSHIAHKCCTYVLHTHYTCIAKWSTHIFVHTLHTNITCTHCTHIAHTSYTHYTHTHWFRQFLYVESDKFTHSSARAFVPAKFHYPSVSEIPQQMKKDMELTPCISGEMWTNFIHCRELPTRDKGTISPKSRLVNWLIYQLQNIEEESLKGDSQGTHPSKGVKL